ncbi:hypothetical protein BaRGS_00017399, partial [Batillaria attramentaria]
GWLPSTLGQGGLDAVLTATESTVTLQFPVGDAQSYVVTWHRTQGFFLIDQFYQAPFPEDPITFTVTDLYPGVSYTFLVFKNGNTSDDRVFKQDIATVPLPPENVQVTGRTSESVLLEWEPGYNSSQTHYEAEYQASGVVETVVINSTDLVYNLTGLMPGHTYLVRIRAVVSLPDIIMDARSNNSVPATAVTLPGMPANLNVVALNTSALRATWEAGNNSLQDSFSVQYSISGDSVVTNTSCAASPCDFLVIGPPGKLFTVYVFAVKDSFLSDPISIDHNTAPVPPSKLEGTGGIRSLQLSWEMPAGSLYDSFLLSLTNTIKGDNITFNVSRNGADTSYNYAANNLVGGIGYFVRIYSVTATEKSIDSSSHLFYTFPEPVTSLSGNAINTTTLQLAWQNPFNSEYRGLMLNLTASTGQEMSYQLGIDDNSFVASGLIPGVEYTVVVVVESNVADSDPASETFRTKPEAPILESVESMEDSLLITLKGGMNGQFDKIMAQLEGDGTELTADNNGKVTFPSLTPGTEYTLNTYTVSGTEQSESYRQAVFTKPRPVQSLSVSVASSSQLDIMWDAPDLGGVDNYTVTLVPSHGAEAPVVEVVSALAFTFTDAHPGETYNVSVVANKGTESSLPVLEQNTTTPLPLMHVRVSLKGTDFVTIAWDVPSGTVYDGFAYDFPFFNETLTELPADPTSKKFESLDANSNYTVTLYVFSRHVDGNILYSLPTTFNFSTYPESVATLQKVDASETTITVNWTAPVSGDFDSYILGHKLARVNVSYTIVSVTANSTNYTFEELEPGEDYSVAIRTKLRRIYGEAVYLEALTKPLAVEGLMVEGQTADSLTIAWNTNSASTQDRFTVRQEKDGVSKSQQVDAIEGQQSYSIHLDQLLAGYAYNVTVTAVREIDTDIEESAPARIDGTTNPLPVVNMTVTAGNQLLTLTWAPAIGSKQEQYRIRYRPTLRDPEAQWLEQTAVTPTSQVPSVFPGEKYDISVYAVSGSQSSEPTNESIVVAPLPPNVGIVRELTTTSEVTLAWEHDPQVTFVEKWAVSQFGDSDSNSYDVARTAEINYTQKLTSLTAGATYRVEVVAVVLGVMSEKVVLNATAKPVINTNIRELAERTTQTEIVFEYSVRAIDTFDFFRFTLAEVPDAAPVEKDKTDTVHEVTFTGLLGGTLYTVNVVTVSGQEVSDSISQQILTVPNNVEVKMVPKPNEITVEFGSLDGSATSYQVQCKRMDDSPCGQQDVGADSPSATITALEPFTNYTFIVVTTASGNQQVKSTSQTYTVRTAEAAPSAVRNVVAQEDGLRTVQLSWEPPMALNGELKSYEIKYSGTHMATGGQDNLQVPITVLPPTTSTRLDNLKAGYTYVFMVQAVTVAVGEEGRATISLSTQAPAFDDGSSPETGKPILPSNPVISETTFTVQLVNPFSDYNGPILGYTVIVSYDPNEATDAPRLPSWEDAHRDSSVKAYQAIGNCSNLFTENSPCDRSSSRSRRAPGDPTDSVPFRLGVQTAGECSGVEYCNGPLKPETGYYVKLRAFTAAGFTDTAYSSKIRTADAPSSSSAAVIGAVVAVVVVVVIGAVIAFIIIRRKRRPRRATKHRPSGPGTARTSWDRSSMKRFSRPVKLSEFPEHVRRMAADSDFKYAEEYEDLKEVGRDQTCYAAELPVNRPKNRFTNILPYDHSRVKLLPTDDEEGSDYINANYMPGYVSKREYIATQGPLPATRDDFWRMLWEQNARNIVMLTRCMEKGREKSDHYWPADSEPKYYGDLQVVVLNETHMPDWTITEFRVSLGDNSRQVRHFHYKAWPDFGVPKNHSSLIRFVRTVREKLIKDGGPIIAHCSAGVGRSGTFIVLDHVLRLIKEKDEVDIFSIVYSLRRERVLMVQTEQQYKFIHECLSCVLEGREDEATYANIGQVNVGFE